MYAITVESLSFQYRRNVPILRDVSFRVRKGEFLSFVGPNGSGKTTLLRLLDRMYVPHTGTISLGDRNVSAYSRAELARRIAFVPQESGMLFPYTSLEVVLMGRAPHTRGKLFENKHDLDIADEVMALTDVTHLAGQPITALSGGERQRVMIARALAQQPEIILLDEPNAHLDIEHQVGTFALMRRLNGDREMTVISVSHDLNLASTYSDRIAVLACGSLAALGTPEEVLTAQRIEEVFRTPVAVDKQPWGGRPRITVVPQLNGTPETRRES